MTAVRKSLKKIKDPLSKRYLRELRDEIGKYLALFAFLTLTIGFVSGFLIADNNMRLTYENSFDKYNVEDGQFVLSEVAPAGLISEIEAEGVSVYPQFYKDVVLENSDTIRVFVERDKVNKSCLMEGERPDADDEIAIDRLYAENNGIKVGDTLEMRGKTFKITGTVALSDYSTMFKNNSDMMFDASDFSIAEVNQGAYDSLGSAGEKYCYVWINDEELTGKARADKRDDLTDAIVDSSYTDDDTLTEILDREDVQSIMFTGDDMGSDKKMMITLMYVLMVIMAFIFAVTTKSTIEKEATVIGTLRANGYTRNELLKHYMVLPVAITLLGALLGNVFGYTVFKNVMSGAYYHSYSLTKLELHWNNEAFILTTVAPVVIILTVNLISISRALRKRPLDFLKRNLRSRKDRNVRLLKSNNIMRKFRYRVISENKGAYTTLFLGILFAMLLLLFGSFLKPVLLEVKGEILDSKFANYQYVLKEDADTDIEGAEEYCVSTVQYDYYTPRKSKTEELMLYGISEDSKYIDYTKDLNKRDVDDLYENDVNECIVTDNFLDKFNLKVGDRIEVHDKYQKNLRELRIVGSCDYSAALSIFINIDDWRLEYRAPEDYFNGYLSNEKLTDIDESKIATVITEDDLTVVADQLVDSMGRLMYLLQGFALILFVLLVFLLSRMIVMKNETSISMMKILGYHSSEISVLYDSATAIVTALSLLISLPVINKLMEWLFSWYMFKIQGWFRYRMIPEVVVRILIIGVICFLVIHLFQRIRVRRFKMSEILKDMD